MLQRWEGGDSNSDDYDLESDMVQSLLGSPRAGGLCCPSGVLTVTSLLDPRIAGVGGEKSFTIAWQSESNRKV